MRNHFNGTRNNTRNKISYSCMPNIKQTIDGHNKTKLSQTATTSEESTCNCRKNEECPMSKKCLVVSIVYPATVSTNDNSPPQTYVGLTENSFKTRYYNHKTSFTLYEKVLNFILANLETSQTLQPCFE